MSPEERARAFDYAFRGVGSGRDGRRAGKGIGLAVTKEILEANGGRISLSSEAGFGSEVTILLPFQRAVAEMAAGVAQRGSSSWTTTRRVGSPSATSSPAEGFAVDAPGDAAARPSGAMRDVPDLVILDVNMPGMSGWELCAILRRQSSTREVPILFLTGRQEVKDRITAMQLGGSDYLAKPFGAGGAAPQGASPACARTTPMPWTEADEHEPGARTAASRPDRVRRRDGSSPLATGAAPAARTSSTTGSPGFRSTPSRTRSAWRPSSGSSTWGSSTSRSASSSASRSSTAGSSTTASSSPSSDGLREDLARAPAWRPTSSPSVIRAPTASTCSSTCLPPAPRPRPGPHARGGGGAPPGEHRPAAPQSPSGERPWTS